MDALGTRHVTVYRADENGYHVLEMRREVGFVQITPNNLQQSKKKVPERENRIAIANSRGAKLLERSRSFQNNLDEVTIFTTFPSFYPLAPIPLGWGGPISWLVDIVLHQGFGLHALYGWALVE